MTGQTLVVVYAVGDAGATGQLVGAATLLEWNCALVHPPLNQQLADSPRALRVGVFAAVDGVGEVIDIARTLVVPDAPDLVLLQLEVASAAPTRGVPVVRRENPEGYPPFLEPTKADIVSALRRVLVEAPPPAPPASPVHNREDPIPWFLRLFGHN